MFHLLRQSIVMSACCTLVIALSTPSAAAAEAATSAASMTTAQAPNSATVTNIKVNGQFAEMLLLDTNTNGFLAASKDEVANTSALDFSMDSLAAIESYLNEIRSDKLDPEDLLRVVLRCGAYVGEVVRRHSTAELHWVDYDEAARESKLVQDAGRDIGTMGVLRAGPDRMCFPLGKVSKFIANGREDSVVLFARVVVSGIEGANQGWL